VRQSLHLTRACFSSYLKSMLPLLPTFTGTAGAWLMLGMKILGAMGFMAAADVVMLYAC
jgi:hypothetical protein